MTRKKWRPAPDLVKKLDRLLTAVTADLRHAERELAATRARLDRAERINAALWELVELASLAGDDWLAADEAGVQSDEIR